MFRAIGADRFRHLTLLLIFFTFHEDLNTEDDVERSTVVMTNADNASIPATNGVDFPAYRLVTTDIATLMIVLDRSLDDFSMVLMMGRLALL